MVGESGDGDGALVGHKMRCELKLLMLVYGDVMKDYCFQGIMKMKGTFYMSRLYLKLLVRNICYFNPT